MLVPPALTDGPPLPSDPASPRQADTPTRVLDEDEEDDDFLAAFVEPPGTVPDDPTPPSGGEGGEAPPAGPDTPSNVEPADESTPGATPTAPEGRSGFAASLAGIDDVSFAPEHLLLSLAVAAGLVLMLVFPALLVEQTLAENYDDIRAWTVRNETVRQRLDRLREQPHRSTFLLFVAAAALVYSFLDPGFGFDRASLATYAGLVIGLLAVIAVLEAATLVHVRRLTGTRGRLQGAPGALLLAVVMVAVSRASGLEPGYVYGVVAAATFSATLDLRTERRSATYAALWTGLAAAAAWLLHQPVSAAAEDGGSFALFLVDAALAAVAVAGMETMAFGLLPLRFLPGEKVKGWNRGVWLGLLGLGWLSVVHIILDPSKGVTEQGAAPPISVMVLFGAFGAFSVAFWGAFRLRAHLIERRVEAAPGDTGPGSDLSALIPEPADGDRQIAPPAAVPESALSTVPKPRGARRSRVT